MKIGVIGIGNMGYAFAIALSKSKNDLVYVYDKSKKLNFRKKNIIKTNSIDELLNSSEIIFIAVKPKDADSLLDYIAPMSKGKTFVSVVAFYPYQKLAEKLAGSQVCKIMTNVASEIGEAPVLAYCDHDVYENIKVILKRLGKPYYVDEKILDALVPIVGSGPAILSYFLESLSEYMLLVGLEKDQADQIVNELAYVTAKYIIKKKINYYDLYKKVTTPAGITVKILKDFDKKSMKGNVIEAIYSNVSEKLKL